MVGTPQSCDLVESSWFLHLLKDSTAGANNLTIVFILPLSLLPCNGYFQFAHSTRCLYTGAFFCCLSAIAHRNTTETAKRDMLLQNIASSSPLHISLHAVRYAAAAAPARSSCLAPAARYRASFQVCSQT